MTFKIPVGGGEIRVSASTSAGCSGARAVEYSVRDLRETLTPGEARAVAAALAACAGEVDLYDSPSRNLAGRPTR